MSFDTVSELESLLERHTTLRIWLGKRSIAMLMADPQVFAAFLRDALADWQQAESNLKLYTTRLRPQDVLTHQISPEISGVALEISRLLDILERLQRSIGPVTLEDVHLKTVKEVERTIHRFETLLQSVIGRFPADEAFLESMLRSIRFQNAMQSWAIGQMRKEVAVAAAKRLPERSRPYHYKRSSIGRAVLDFRNHVWLLSTAILAVLFLALSQSNLSHMLVRPWLRAVIWGVAAVLLVWALGHRRWRAALSVGVIAGLVLLWSYGLMPSFVDAIEPIKTWAKLFLWVTVLLWFPVQFLGVPKGQNSSQLVILAVLWSGMLALWTYGIFKGAILAAVLLAFPVAQLLGAPRRELRHLSGILDKRVYAPTAVCLVVTAILVTQEGLWFRAAVIWILFTTSVGHSYRYFRKTYDLIEDLYPGTRGRDLRHRLVFLSLVVTIILLSPGVLGRLDSGLVADLYLRVAGLAFGLITILIAVQAIVPGITTWSSESKMVDRLREMRSVLRANAGLEGFMRWFFLLFLFSVAGWLVTSRFLANQPVVVDLSFESAFSSPLGISSLIHWSGASRVNGEAVAVALSTVLFSAFVYLVAYGIAQLYYLFIAANTLTLPIRDSLLSVPVVLRQVTICAASASDDAIAGRRAEIESLLAHNRALNGIVIDRLVVESADERISAIGSILIEIEMDFVELDDLYALVRESLGAAFGCGNVEVVELIVVRRTHRSIAEQRVLSIRLDHEEWEFLQKEMSGFPFDYKLSVLGASVADYIVAESQIA